MLGKKQDKESFSKALGSIGLGAAISLNPVALVILIVAAGIGYNTLVCKNAVQRGGALSLVALGTSALIPGPLALGVIPGIVLAMYAKKKMGKDFVPMEFLSNIIQRAQDPVVRQIMLDQITNLLKRQNISGAA